MTAENDNALEQVLTELLSVLRSNDFPVEARQKRFAGLRKAHPEFGPGLDDALVRHICAQAQAFEELSEAFDKLRKMAQKLSSAPIREGICLGKEALADGRVLARVESRNGTALLELADDDLLARLQPGDRVYLTAESNAVIGKAEVTLPGAGECAVVERWLSDGRLIVRHHDQSIVVSASPALTPAGVKAGDSVRLDRDALLAMERMSGDENSRYAASADATSLPPEALAGYDDIRDGTLRRITAAVAYPEIAATYGIATERPKILLGGPPGTGKSTLARIIAGLLNRETGEQCTIRKVNGAELLSPFVGETEQKIKSLFRDAGTTTGWSILVIDEVDAIARTRGGAGNVHSDRFLSTWLSEIEGIEGRSKFILVATTNRLDMLDSAFRSRFSHEIEMPRPRMDAARAIFTRHLASHYPYYPGGDAAEKTRHAMIEGAVAKLYLPGVTGATLSTLRLRDGKIREVQARDLMSGRLIEQICIDARERAFQRHVEGDNSGMCADDLDGAVEAARDRLRATLTPHNVHGYLTDLPADVGVVAVEPAARSRASVTFLHQAAR